VYLNQGSNLVASDEIVVGDNVRLADFATVYDAHHHDLDVATPARSAPVHIGSEVWIGRNALILPGVQIGEGAVVAAGAIVSHDVPPRTLVAGVPARPIRELDMPPGWTRP
jgi:acetyltransferase-like isoleucine patch superfamily enzyme